MSIFIQISGLLISLVSLFYKIKDSNKNDEDKSEEDVKDNSQKNTNIISVPGDNNSISITQKNQTDSHNQTNRLDSESKKNNRQLLRNIAPLLISIFFVTGISLKGIYVMLSQDKTIPFFVKDIHFSKLFESYKQFLNKLTDGIPVVRHAWNFSPDPILSFSHFFDWVLIASFLILFLFSFMDITSSLKRDSYYNELKRERKKKRLIAD